MDSLLRFALFRFELVCLSSTRLPAQEHVGALLRDRFGSALRHSTCPVATQACRQSCQQPEHCAYARLFETSSNVVEAGTLQGKDLYRPYVIEPPSNHKRVFEAGDSLVFHVTLIGEAIEAFPYFVLAFEEMGRHGFGMGRTPWKLRKVESIPWQNAEEVRLAFDGQGRQFGECVFLKTFEEVEAESRALSENRICLNLRTPLRLEHQGELVKEITPDLLCRTLLRRISRLAQIWCGKTMEMNFAEQIALWSEQFQIHSQFIRLESWNRYSMRQGKQMKFSGLRGNLILEGDLTTLRHYLKLGEYLHIGKHTVFGLGRYECK